jgi:hypothetical protein
MIFPDLFQKFRKEIVRAWLLIVEAASSERARLHT